VGAQTKGAEPAAEGAAVVEAGAPEGSVEGKTKKNKKGELAEAQAPIESTEASMLEVKGRVFARMAFEDDVVEAGVGRRRGLAFTVPDARASLRARVLAWVNLVLEADFGQPRPSLKDGFLQARAKRWMLRGGQFKMPISAFTLESPWTLPLARRGWLHELLSDGMLLMGRRQGVAGRVRGGGFWDPELTVGVFQSVFWGPDAGRPLPLIGITEPTVVGRLAVSAAGVEIAAVSQRRVTNFQVMTPEGLQIEHRGFWAAGGDITADLRLEKTGWRVWGEALTGSRWLVYRVEDEAYARFVAARILAAWRWAGLAKGETYFELFTTAGLLEPDLNVISDLFWEAMAGVNVGHWRQTRLTLQFEKAGSQRNFPGDQLFYGRQALKTHTAVVLQAGAAF
jgi:hypothetical protein